MINSKRNKIKMTKQSQVERIARLEAMVSSIQQEQTEIKNTLDKISDMFSKIMKEERRIHKELEDELDRRYAKKWVESILQWFGATAFGAAITFLVIKLIGG